MYKINFFFNSCAETYNEQREYVIVFLKKWEVKTNIKKVVWIFKNVCCVCIILIRDGLTCSMVQITTGTDDKGLKLYDPGYLNTAPVRSSISYTDGDEGILRYRGYPIEELAESSTFLEVAYLLSKSCIIINIIIIK